MADSEVQMKLPDDVERSEWERKREERLARQEAENKLMREQAIRIEALTRATDWCSGDNWTGGAPHVVAAAQVFEHYITEGKAVTPARYAALIKKARQTFEASRR